MVSPVSAPSPLDNQFCHIISPYSMIINSSQNSNEFDSSNVKDISGQKKRKLIIKSNDSLKRKKKSKHNFMKKAREDGMKKILLIVEG